MDDRGRYRDQRQEAARTYDMRSVELVMLIKQAKDKGMTLPAAIEAAREFQARRMCD